MKTSKEVKAEFDNNLNHKKISNLELTENQKYQLNAEYVNFIQVRKVNLENFITKKRQYIEDNKHLTMTIYFEKLIAESDTNI